jgi:hypothetical protein
MSTVWAWFADRLSREGSTRGVSLIRLGLPPLLWDRYANELLPFRTLGGDHVWTGVSFFLSTTLLFFGVQSRLSAAWTGATLLYMFFGIGVAGGHEPWTHHHTFLLTVAPALLALTPCGGSWSFDRWRTVRAAERAGRAPAPEHGPLWAVPLLALQLSAIWAWGAWDKCNAGFLSGERMQHHLLALYFGSDAPSGAWWPWAAQLLAVSTVVLEFAFAFGMFWRRAQPWLVPMAMVFHGLLFVLLPVGPFSLTMWLLMLAYLEPAEVHRFFDRMHAPVGERHTA